MEQRAKPLPGALLPRPSSPNKRNIAKLPDIPEATPGPNAFAQQAMRVEKHRLAGNAFYQQEVQRRKATPPTIPHPAHRRASDPPSPPQTQTRDSQMTTMSPFINAGTKKSPPLMLIPEQAQNAWPTKRGFIEERREKMEHTASGAETERTPVFQYTPKMSSSEFGKPSVPSKPMQVKIAASTSADQTKSPRKGLFGKLLGQSRGTASPSVSNSNLGNSETHEDGSLIPPKAQAVLGSNSPSKTALGRTPSKKKGLFSRRTTEGGEPNASKISVFRRSAETEPAPLTFSATKTAFSDPTPELAQAGFSTPRHDPFSERGMSQSLSESGRYKPRYNSASSQTEFSTYVHGHGHDPFSQRVSQSLSGRDKPKYNSTGSVARTQSLQYMDKTIPPTPPAKNTPPHEKEEIQETKGPLVGKPRGRHLNANLTTPPQAVKISTNERLSPTKFGNYAHKEQPMLVHKPSIYSMHASVFPDLDSTTTFEEMKARVDGLGLEGMSRLPDHIASRPELFYSPSIYSDDWGSPRPRMSVQAPPPLYKHTHSGSMPSLLDHYKSPSVHTKKGSSSSGGTVTICYPGLIHDPSVANLEDVLVDTSVGPEDESRDRINSLLAVCQQPRHGQTHSSDHMDDKRQSTDASLFAQSFPENCSPTSLKHKSAVPSPLHFLPATVYTPPPKKGKDKLVEKDTEQRDQPDLLTCDFQQIQQGSGVSMPAGSQTPTAQMVPLQPSPKVTQDLSKVPPLLRTFIPLGAANWSDDEMKLWLRQFLYTGHPLLRQQGPVMSNFVDVQASPYQMWSPDPVLGQVKKMTLQEQVDEQIRAALMQFRTANIQESQKEAQMQAIRQVQLRSGKSERAGASSQNADTFPQTGSPVSRNKLFDNIPSLKPGGNSLIHREESPPDSPVEQFAREAQDVDPKKPSVSFPSVDKMDEILRMLGNMQNHADTEVKAMRAELQATSARIDERLAAVENASLHESDPLPLYRPHGKLESTYTKHYHRQRRVDIDQAHPEEITYCRPLSTQMEEQELAAERMRNSNPIARLANMVGGMVDRLERMEKRMGGGTGQQGTEEDSTDVEE